jgi:hypothetical protein
VPLLTIGKIIEDGEIDNVDGPHENSDTNDAEIINELISVKLFTTTFLILLPPLLINSRPCNADVWVGSPSVYHKMRIGQHPVESLLT